MDFVCLFAIFSGKLNGTSMQSFVRYLLWSALALAGLFLLWYFRSVFVFIALSGVLSLITRPLFDVFKKLHLGRVRPGNGVAALLTVLVIWVFIVLFFRFTLPLLGGELRYLSEVDYPALFDQAQLLLQEVLAPLHRIDADFFEQLEKHLTLAVGGLLDVSRLKGAFSGMLGFLGSLAVTAFSVTFITFFFLKEEGLFVRLLMVLIPDEHENGVRHVLHSVKILLRRYFIGILIQIFLICFFVTLGFLLLGLEFEHALTIGFVSGLFNVIPYVGPVLGGAFGILTASVIYMQLSFELAFLSYLGFALLIYVVVQLMDNLLFQPLIFSTSVRAHPLEIFIVILMSGYLSGILGMFLAIPVYTIVRVIAREFFYKYRVVKKLTDGFA